LASISTSNSCWGGYKFKPWLEHWLFWLIYLSFSFIFSSYYQISNITYKKVIASLSPILPNLPYMIMVSSHSLQPQQLRKQWQSIYLVKFEHLLCLFWDLGWGLCYEWHVVRNYIKVSENFQHEIYFINVLLSLTESVQ
jgi:hypothetical protein